MLRPILDEAFLFSESNIFADITKLIFEGFEYRTNFLRIKID
jgi:hypothetical protein